MNRQEILDSWNAHADEYNQWDDLGEDEKLDWAMQMEREACAKVCEAQENKVVQRHPARIEFDPNSIMARSCAAAIRARGKQK